MPHHPDDTASPTTLPVGRKPSRARVKAQRAAAAVPGGASDARTGSVFQSEWMHLVRESSEYGNMLFAKMIQQTLEPYATRPGVRKALDLGIAILERGPAGDALRRSLGVRTIFRPKSSKVLGYLFQLDDDWFLYALTSAAQTTIAGENLWTTLLCETLRDLRPKNLGAGPTSRIARLKELGAQVSLAVKQTGTTVFVYEAPQGLNLREAGGDATWGALVMAADYEYHATVARLITGTLFELKNNRFPRAEMSLPPGFVFARNGEGKPIPGSVVIDPDPSRLAMVRDLLADGATEATNADLAHRYSSRGLTSRWTAAAPVPASETGDPGGVVGRVFAHLNTYVTGKYTFRLECSLPSVTAMHGLTVHREHPDDNGYFEVELDFGLPVGGFVSDDVASSVRSRRLMNAPGTSGVQRETWDRKPLSGRREWADAEHDYVLDADDKGVYVVRRRARSATTLPGRRSTIGKGEGTIVGRLPAARLHGDLARAALAALGKPIAADRPDMGEGAAGRAARLADVSRELIASRSLAQERAHTAANFRMLAGASATTNERLNYADLVRRAEAEAEEAEADVARLQGELSVRPVDGLTVDVGPLAAALIVLGRTQDKADFALFEALRDFVVDFRAECEVGQPIATVTFGLRLHASDGSITLGPISLTTRNTAIGVAGTPARSDAIHERNLALTLPWLLGEVTPAEVAEHEGIDLRSLRRRTHDVLRSHLPNEAARAAIIDCPIVETRRVVLGALAGARDDAGFSADRAREIRQLYYDPNFSWTPSWVSDATIMKRVVLDFVDRYATDPNMGVHLDVVRARVDVAEVFLYRLLNDDPAKYVGASVRPAPRPVLDRAPGWNLDRAPKRELKAVCVRRCTWCGERTLLQPLRVPEVADELICTHCGCSAASDEPWPGDYLLSWDGPFGRRKSPGKDIAAKGDRSPHGTRLVPLPDVPILVPRHAR